MERKNAHTIKYMIKFRSAADEFGIRNVCVAERCENGEIFQISKTGRYVMPWRFICESVYAILLDEDNDQNIVIASDIFLIAQINQNWNYFQFDQLQLQKRLKIDFIEVWDSNNHLDVNCVLNSIDNFRIEQPHMIKTDVDFFVINRQRYDLAHKPCGALVLLKSLDYEKTAPEVITRQGQSTEVIREALISAIRCLKKPCHITIYIEPLIGLMTTYHGDKDDSLDKLYELMRLGEHSFEIIHFSEHINYKKMKERVSTILKEKMIDIENNI